MKRTRTDILSQELKDCDKKTRTEIQSPTEQDFERNRELWFYDLCHHGELKVLKEYTQGCPLKREYLYRGLYKAVYSDRFQVTKYLLELGADPDGVKPEGFEPAIRHDDWWPQCSPLMIAVSRSTDVVRLLLNNGARVDGATSNSTHHILDLSMNNLSTFKLLIKHGADINGKSNGRPLLARVAFQGSNQIFEYMMKLDAVCYNPRIFHPNHEWLNQRNKRIHDKYLEQLREYQETMSGLLTTKRVGPEVVDYLLNQIECVI